jgi:hypothetical protein
VGCTVGGTLERGVDACTTSMAGRDGVEVVMCSMWLGTHSTGWLVCFASLRMVSVALAIRIKIQEDHEFIVTRATVAIALYLLHTDPTQQHCCQSGF